MSHDHHHHHGECCDHHHHHHDECCHHEHHHACHEQQTKYADELLALADEAWMEVLKEKIKDQIRSTSSQHLDALAKLISQANHNRWKHKMEGKTTKEDFEQNLQQILHQNKQG